MSYHSEMALTRDCHRAWLVEHLAVLVAEGKSDQELRALNRDAVWWIRDLMHQERYDRAEWAAMIAEARATGVTEFCPVSFDTWPRAS